jgi:hypothetical protein
MKVHPDILMKTKKSRCQGLRATVSLPDAECLVQGIVQYVGSSGHVIENKQK